MTPEIILGPPGTGKTTRLLSMVEDEIARGTPPDRIGYFSFTKQAANEAVSRACEKFSLDRRDLRYFRTLHSLCFQGLGLSNSDVFEGKKMLEFGDWLGVELTEHKRIDETTMFGFTPGDRALFMENLARVSEVSLRDMYERGHDDLDWRFVEMVSRALSEYKKSTGLLDYTDMLEQFVRGTWHPKLDVVFVDEAQDLSMLQWRVVNKVSQTARRVVIAGDDDQAIYRWAGAAVEYFVRLRGLVTVLDQSWRVPVNVQSVSNSVISGVRNRREKVWRPRKEDGTVSRCVSFEDADTSGTDVLILARNAFVLKDVEASLVSDGVIYTFRGRSSVNEEILTAVRSWENLRAGKTVTADEAKMVYAFMSSGVGVKRGYKSLHGTPPDQPVDLSWLKQNGGLLRDDIWHEALDRIPHKDMAYMLRARQKGERLSGDVRVRLSTIHGSKGGEADHVILLTDMARRTYEESLLEPEDEARVWYVASTRARNQLTIVAPATRMSFSI